MAKGGESMTLDGFMKAIDPYSLLVVEVFIKDNRSSIYLKGSKYDILAQLNVDYRKLEIYQLSLRYMINVKDNDKIEYYIYIIAKEN